MDDESSEAKNKATCFNVNRHDIVYMVHRIKSGDFQNLKKASKLVFDALVTAYYS